MNLQLKFKSNMKRIWNYIKERWPLAVMGALLGIEILMII